MNKYRFSITTFATVWLLMSAAISPAAEQTTTVKLADLPAAVQAAIHEHVGKGKLGLIEKTIDDGEITYDVEMKKANRERSFTIGADGTLLDMEVFLHETPMPVQAAIKKQAGASEIESITKTFDDGDVSYEVDSTRSGKDYTFILDEAGKLTRLQMFMAELPAPVQKAVQKESAGGKMGDIFKVMEDNEVTYEVEINPDAASRVVTIDEKGNVVSSEEDLVLAKAPAAVQATIKDLGKDGTIGGISKVTEAREVSYDVDVKRKGAWDSVSIGTDGKIIP